MEDLKSYPNKTMFVRAKKWIGPVVLTTLVTLGGNALVNHDTANQAKADQVRVEQPVEAKMVIEAGFVPAQIDQKAAELLELPINKNATLQGITEDIYKANPGLENYTTQLDQNGRDDTVYVTLPSNHIPKQPKSPGQ